MPEFKKKNACTKTSLSLNSSFRETLVVPFGLGSVHPADVLFCWPGSLQVGLGSLVFFFSEKFFHQKRRSVSVSTGTLPCVAVTVVARQQNPQGGGV